MYIHQLLIFLCIGHRGAGHFDPVVRVNDTYLKGGSGNPALKKPRFYRAEFVCKVYNRRLCHPPLYSRLLMQNAKRLGTASVGRLLMELGLPAMVGTMVNALYNIVDRLYIGRGCGTSAMAGLSLTFPYMMILAAFGTLIGVGSGTLLSIRLGEGRRDEAEKLLGQCVAVKLAFFLAIPVLAWLTLDKTLVLFGGNAESIPYARDYLQVILIGNIFAHLSFGLSAMMRAEGHSKKAMYCMIIGAVANVILDPIFIFALDMGIRGAAWATNIAMFLSCLYAFHHFLGPRCIVPLKLGRIRIWPGRLIAVFAIGLSPFLLQLVASLVQISLNTAFRLHAESDLQNTLAIACSGIINGILIFVLQPVFGLSQGMQPVVGYNYGAKQFGRVAKAYRLGMLYATALCTVGTVVCLVFAGPLVSCFTADPDVHKLATWALRVSCAAFPLIGAPIMTTTYFQSVGRAKTAIFLSLLRQVVMLIPLIFILPMVFGLRGVWIAGPMADSLSFLIVMTAVTFEFAHLRKLRDQPGSVPDVL